MVEALPVRVHTLQTNSQHNRCITGGHSHDHDRDDDDKDDDDDEDYDDDYHHHDNIQQTNSQNCYSPTTTMMMKIHPQQNSNDRSQAIQLTHS